MLHRRVVGQHPTKIAAALPPAVKTVSTHKSRILDKWQLPSAAALVRYGPEHGLDAAGDSGFGGLAAPQQRHDDR